MAVDSTIRQITRDKLFAIFKTEEAVRLFESLLTALRISVPTDIADVQAAVDAHIAKTTGAHQASAIGNTPAGGIVANNVQAALNELDTKKQVVLVSGTNIKTLNSVSILGSGDIALAGTGDVVGPASAVADHVVTFSGATGKLVKDSGLTLAGTNTGDQTISIGGDVTAAGGAGALAATVTKINGTALSGLATGILKNTTATGVPSIAAAGTDYVAPGGALGTPSSGTLTNCTGLPIAAGVSGLAAGVAAFLAAPNSANMAAMITDETGTGSNVFATSPSLTTPALSAPTFSTSAAVTAGTNAQGQGPLTSDYNIITTAAAAPSGVTLPTATVGRKVLVINKGANSVNVYPATGAAIDGIAANSPINLPVGCMQEFDASSTTQWNTFQQVANPVFVGNEYVQQSAPASLAAAATLTAAQMLGGIIQYTGAAAALTLPTGTLMDGAVVAGLAVDRAFDVCVVNTGTGAATMTAGVGFTIVGAAAVTNGTSARYLCRKTAANTYVAYRVG